jgi:lipopolysaccharide transport system permease protein
MIEYEIKPQEKFTFGFKELWQYRELFYFFTLRDIKVKYNQAVLGFLWALLQPVTMMIVFTVVFSKGLKLSSEGIPYPIFALSGLLIWNIFSSGLLNSANSMVRNGGIIKKIYFPRLIIPVSATLAILVDTFFAFIAFWGIILFYQQPVNLGSLLICLPLSIIISVITTLGLGIFLSALNVKYRDFQYIIPFLIQFLLFVNPVLYSSKIFENSNANFFMKLNPIAVSINLIRIPFLNSNIDWFEVALGILLAISFLFIGIYTFQKTESYFADLV